jgi:hypothetical protein
MKKFLIALNLVIWSFVGFQVTSYAAEPAKKQETNCVTKDKKGNCPPAPKSEKPTPKKVEKKDTKTSDPAKK